MELLKRYQNAISDILKKVDETQHDAIVKAGKLVADAVEHGKKIYFASIGHQIEQDLLYRGGGPIFYLPYHENETELHPGDVLFVSSVSGRTKKVVDLAYDSVAAGVTVIAFTSMSYAVAVDPVHPSGKKLYEIATLTLDNCAPAAEAMLDVDGIEAKFAAPSGLTADYIMWSLTCVTVEQMMKDGYAPGILKSANFPGGLEYDREVIEKHYAEYGY